MKDKTFSSPRPVPPVACNGCREFMTLAPRSPRLRLFVLGFCLLATLAEDPGTLRAEEPATDTPVPLAEAAPGAREDLDQLKEDARRLARDFRSLFKNLSGVAAKTIGPLVDSAAGWIEENYALLSAESRKRLKDFVETFRGAWGEAGEFAGQSMEALASKLRELKELMDQMEKERGMLPESEPRKTRPEGIAI